MSNKDYKIQKKLLKQQYKLEKNERKSVLHTDTSSSPSLYVRFAESTKGILYIILAVSLFAAVIMDQSGLILTLEDIVDSLILARLGKTLILIIAVALFIYGLKNLRIMK